MFARQCFGNRSPIGRHFSFGREGVTVEIVGVVKDARSTTMREAPERTVYTPYMQHHDVEDMTFLVRTTGPPGTLADGIRRAVHQRDANLPVFGLKTMVTQVEDSLLPERMMAVLAAAFGVLAVLLAALGLYGVLAHSVARRQEIGVRMALGAGRRSVVALVLGEVAVLVVAGVAIGVPLALGATRLLQSQLFGLSPGDPVSLVVAVVVITSAALVAAYLPARYAAGVDPVSAMRWE
jgi:predicted lysophospholipase L1 biosynthesis ABC-type transport system permease subunit